MSRPYSMGEMRNAYNTVLGKPEGPGPLVLISKPHPSEANSD
jgi:hypothetical protein